MKDFIFKYRFLLIFLTLFTLLLASPKIAFANATYGDVQYTNICGDGVNPTADGPYNCEASCDLADGSCNGNGSWYVYMFICDGFGTECGGHGLPIRQTIGPVTGKLRLYDDGNNSATCQSTVQFDVFSVPDPNNAGALKGFMTLYDSRSRDEYCPDAPSPPVSGGVGSNTGTINGLTMVQQAGSYVSDVAGTPAKYIPGQQLKVTFHVNNSNDTPVTIDGRTMIFQIPPGYCANSDLRDRSGIGGTDIPGTDPGLGGIDLGRDDVNNSQNFTFDPSNTSTNDPNKNNRECQTSVSTMSSYHLVDSGSQSFTLAPNAVTNVSMTLTIPNNQLLVGPEGYYQWDTCLAPWCIWGVSSEASAAGFIRVIPVASTANHPPTVDNLKQFKPSGNTQVPSAGWINKEDVQSAGGSPRVRFKFDVHDIDGDQINYRLRARQVDGSSDTNYYNSSGVGANGETKTVSSFVYDNLSPATLPDGKYRWGVEVNDGRGGTGASSFGTSSSTEIDFGLDTGLPGASISTNPTSSSSGVSISAEAESATNLNVSWSGFDSLSGVANYDVEYAEADSCPPSSSGQWKNWKTDTTSTSDAFNTTPNQSYCFRVRATDVAGNVGEWVTKLYTPVIRAWIQVKGGDVHSNGGINLSGTPNSKHFADGRGVISSSSNTSDIYFGKNNDKDLSYPAHSPSNPDWVLKDYDFSSSSLANWNYDSFYNRLVAGQNTIPFTGVKPTSSGVYYDSSISTTLNGDWHVGSNIKAVIIVNGDIHINTEELTIPVGSSVVFVAKDRIKANPIVKKMQGVFLAQGQLVTIDSGVQLEGEGSFISIGGGFDLTRNLNNANKNTPAERFTYRPDFFINMLERLGESKFSWQEVAP